MKKIIKLFAVLTLAGSSLSAQDDATKKGGIEVDLTFATNYVFRGVDVYADYYRQQGKAQGSFQSPGSFQPSITFATPVDGLSFNIWGAFAMSGRGDKDVDGVLQQSPGGSDLLSGSYPNITPAVIQNAFQNPAALGGAALPTNIAGYEYQTCKAAATPNCPTNFYKEEVGLARKDEVDLTLDYSSETRVGNVGFGIVTYITPGVKDKDGYGSITEIYLNYALPVLPELTFAVYSNFDSSNKYQYYNLGYERGIDLGNDMGLTFALGAGYYVKNQQQGLNDISGGVTLSKGGFSLGVNFANRQDMRFYDGDPDTTLPLWLQGGSTADDGLVEDYSMIDGMANSYINGVISNAIGVTYTPRQKLPKTLVYVTAGYTIEI